MTSAARRSSQGIPLKRVHLKIGIDTQSNGSPNFSISARLRRLRAEVMFEHFQQLDTGSVLLSRDWQTVRPPCQLANKHAASFPPERAGEQGGHALDNIRETAAQSSLQSGYQSELQRATTSEETIRGSYRTREIGYPFHGLCGIQIPSYVDVLRCVSCSGTPSNGWRHCSESD